MPAILNQAEATTGGGPCLAVVIPAWRAQHLGSALRSLREQTDRRFRLYIGDDGSPDDIAAVVARETTGLDVIYHRYEENLGGRDLVAHWHRCIALTQGEPWICLFSDDDEMEPGCVAAFYHTLAAGTTGAQLLRFDFTIIDGDGREVRSPLPNVPRESAAELLEAILTGGGREWRAPEHIFSRRVFTERGGFLSLPRALFSDLATWVEFAAPGGVITMPGPRIRWRSHADGTSSGQRMNYQVAWLDALEGFVRWVGDFRRRYPTTMAPVIVERFLFRELRRISPPVPWRWTGRMADALRSIPLGAGRATLGVFAAIGFTQIRHLPGISHCLTWRYRRNLGRK